MTNVTILDAQAHRGLRVQPLASARYGDNQRFVQVVLSEFGLLAVHYPILLTKDSNTGGFFCGAVLGIDAGENLFLDESKGFETYRPLNLQRGPFYTVGSELAIDLDNPRVGAPGAKPLFGETGAPTPYLESIVKLMGDLRQGAETTKLFVDTLMSLKLVESIAIDLAFDDGTRRDVQGLYTINQDALRALPDGAVLDLFRRGYLQPIYLMIASLKQIPVVAAKKNSRLLQASDALAGNLV